MDIPLPRVCLALSIMFLAACDDTMHANYPTAAAARADGAVDRGWLPPSLPASAFEISESHDLDTNTGEGSFRFDARDSDAFRSQLLSLPPAPMQSLGRDRARLQSNGYSFHSDSGFVLAVNWQKCHVHFWLPYERNPQG